MSIMICEVCEEQEDIDFHGDGIWSDTGYTCENCSENIREAAQQEKTWLKILNS